MKSLVLIINYIEEKVPVLDIIINTGLIYTNYVMAVNTSLHKRKTIMCVAYADIFQIRTA